MSHSKEFFMGTFGIKRDAFENSQNIILQRDNETEPFGVIYAGLDGKYVLRIGEVNEVGLVHTVK